MSERGVQPLMARGCAAHSLGESHLHGRAVVIREALSMHSACTQHALSMHSEALSMHSDVHLRLEAHIEHPIGFVEHEDLASP